MGKRLSKIYTRTGDDGTTGLADGERVDKCDVRVEAFGSVDETNGMLGLLLAEPDLPAFLSELAAGRANEVSAETPNSIPTTHRLSASRTRGLARAARLDFNFIVGLWMGYVSSDGDGSAGMEGGSYQTKDAFVNENTHSAEIFR